MKELSQKIYPKSGGLLIGELSKKTNTKVVTIRFYESLGFFPDPRYRASNKSRRYSSSYIDRLLFIKKARKLGFSLKEVLEMVKLSEKRKKIPKKRLAKKVYNKLDIIQKRMNDLRLLRKELQKIISES